MLDVDDKYRCVDGAVTFAPDSPFHGDYKAMRDVNIHAGKYHKVDWFVRKFCNVLANREQVLESTFTLPTCTYDDLITYLLLYRLPIGRRTNRALLRSARFSVYNFVIIFE